VAEEADHLGHRQKAVRLIPAVSLSRQAGLPVRGEQVQRRPALGPPRVGHLTALEHDVVDRAVGEAATHGEPGMARPDDTVVVRI
jgi:hypothetical protein